MNRCICRYSIFVFLLFSVVLSWSQTDSSLYFLQQIKQDTFSYKEKESLFKTAVQYAKVKQDLYLEIKIRIKESELFFYEGNYRVATQNLEDCLKQINKQLKIQPSQKWKNLHIDCLAQLGRSKVYFGLYDEAIVNFKTIMELYGDDAKSEARAKAYNGLGIVFAARGHYKLAEEYLLKSLHIYKVQNNPRGLYIVYSNLGGTSLEQGKHEEALTYCYEVHKIVLHEKYEGSEQIYSSINLAIAYQNLKKYDLAEKYLLDAWEMAKRKKYVHLESYILSNYADNLYLQGKYDQALKATQEVVLQCRKEGVKNREMWALKLLSNIYEKQGNLAMSLKYLKQGNALFDTIYAKETDEKILSLKFQFDNYKATQEICMKEKNLQLYKEQVAKRNLWIAFLLLLSIVFGIAIVFMVKRILLQCRVNNLMKERMSKMQEGGNKHIEEIKTKLEQELNSKNKELASNALLLLKFNELSSTLTTKVKALKVNFALKGKEKLLLSEMESILKDFVPIQSWNEFKVYFEQVDGGFFKHLEQSYPNLTPNEQRLCALIRLNLNTKEIASLTNRSFKSVEMAKLRLRKKLALTTDENFNEDTLYTILSKID
ncbi:MAG: tetratricopeptide repeat protein [Bacteroidales bacterium]